MRHGCFWLVQEKGIVHRRFPRVGAAELRSVSRGVVTNE